MRASDYLQKIKDKLRPEYRLDIMPKKGAVIVETRQVKDLGLIVKNHLHFLPNDYGLTVFHSNLNRDFVYKELKDISGVNWINIGNNHLSETTYNYLLTSDYFWKMLCYEKTLIFQTDSLMLRNGIDLFERYDYIGAVWKHIGKQVGNGGFSLRTNSIMKEICKAEKYNHIAHGNEDIYFSNRIEKYKGKKASADVAQMFSVETMYYDRPIGVHAADKWLSKTELETIYTNSLNEI
jgi:hypothetical protein